MQTLIAQPTLAPIRLTRAVRIGAFAFETWSRMVVDGGHGTAPERAHELSWVAENLCALHGVRIQVRGPLPRSACVLVANHINYFDPLILAGLLPLAVVAKREVAEWPVIGDVCRRLGVLFVERDNAYSGATVLRQARAALEQDVSVLVFPEGTTTRGDVVLPFKRGIFGVAALAQVPIVPVTLRYAREDAAWIGNATFLPHYLRTMSHRSTHVSVQFLPAIQPNARATAQALAAAARAAIRRALPARSRAASTAYGGEAPLVATA